MVFGSSMWKNKRKTFRIKKRWGTGQYRELERLVNREQSSERNTISTINDSTTNKIIKKIKTILPLNETPCRPHTSLAPLTRKHLMQDKGGNSRQEMRWHWLLQLFCSEMNITVSEPRRNKLTLLQRYSVFCSNLAIIKNPTWKSAPSRFIPG